MAATAQQLLEKGGLTRWVAIAIVKVLGAESGLRTSAENPKEGAYGIAQWTDTRKAALFAFAAARHEPADALPAQVAFLLHELNTYESGTLSRLRATRNINEAITVFVTYFERPEDIPAVIKTAGGTPVMVGASGGGSAASAAPMAVATSGDPPDRSHKIFTTGKGMGEQGSHFSGHVAAMRNLRNRHATIKLRS